MSSEKCKRNHECCDGEQSSENGTKLLKVNLKHSEGVTICISQPSIGFTLKSCLSLKLDPIDSKSEKMESPTTDTSTNIAIKAPEQTNQNNSDTTALKNSNCVSKDNSNTDRSRMNQPIASTSSALVDNESKEDDESDTKIGIFEEPSKSLSVKNDTSKLSKLSRKLENCFQTQILGGSSQKLPVSDSSNNEEARINFADKKYTEENGVRINEIFFKYAFLTQENKFLREKVEQLEKLKAGWMALKTIHDKSDK